MDIKVLYSGDEAVLTRVAEDVFAHPIHADAAVAYLADPRHHIAVALDDGVVVGFASGVHYFHPDNLEPELLVNQVSVAPTHRQRGIGAATVEALLQAARELGCVQARMLTDRGNPAAMRLCETSGGTPTDEVTFSFELEPATNPRGTLA